MIWQRIGLRAPLRGGDGPVDGARLAIGVVLVLAIVLATSWMSRVDAACSSFGVDYCAGPGTNPCNYSTCTPTGPNYTCTAGDVSFDELNYILTGQPNVWYRCSFQTSSMTTYNCSETSASCGTVTHYPGGFNPPNPCSGQTCSGSWSWLGCQGSGTWCNYVQAPPG